MGQPMPESGGNGRIAHGGRLDTKLIRPQGGGGGGATPRFWTPTTPQLTVGQRPLGGGAGRGGSGRGTGGAAGEGGSPGGRGGVGHL